MKEIFVTKPSMPSFEDYTNEIKSIWDIQYLTNFGPKYNALIDKLKERFGYEFVDLQCNGHMTLQNILSCIEPGEIITTPFTFISTSLAIKNSGHTPVYCDINEDDYTIDVDKIEDLITDNTVAIVAVHVFGTPCDNARLEEIAGKHNLKLVYDAAHAFGVSVDGKNIGSMGDASMFSFHATKVFNTIEGGMAVFGDEEWLNEARSRSNFGLDDGEALYLGVNSKMNEFQAAMGILNLKDLDDNIAKRKAITDKYDSVFSKIKSLKIMKRKDNIQYNYSYYPIVLNPESGKNIEDLLAAMQARNVYGRRYFYPSLNTVEIFESKEKTPISEKISDNIICLPLFADMTEEEVERVCSVVKEYCINE